MDVVDKIVAMPTQNGDLAVDPVKIIKATVEQVTLPPEPAPGDPDLEALFPSTVNGESFTAHFPTNGQELRAQVPADDPFGQQVEEALGTVGIKLEDLSTATAAVGTQDDGVNVTAFRVAGWRRRRAADLAAAAAAGVSTISRRRPRHWAARTSP